MLIYPLLTTAEPFDSVHVSRLAFPRSNAHMLSRQIISLRPIKRLADYKYSTCVLVLAQRLKSMLYTNSIRQAPTLPHFYQWLLALCTAKNLSHLTCYITGQIGGLSFLSLYIPPPPPCRQSQIPPLTVWCILTAHLTSPNKPFQAHTKNTGCAREACFYNSKDTCSESDKLWQTDIVKLDAFLNIFFMGISLLPQTAFFNLA